MWQELLPIGIQIASSFLGSQGQESGQESTNAFNVEEAQKNRDFQERLFRNRHTYEVEDLLRAGLNPILSAKYGGGSVPTGAQAVVDNPKGHYTETALSTARQLKELSLLDAQRENIKADTSEKNTQASRNRGLVRIPGLGEVPLETAIKFLSNRESSNAKDGSKLINGLSRFAEWNLRRDPLSKVILH